MEQKLRLIEFKTLYNKWRIYIPSWDFLLFAILWWIEQWVIETRIKIELDKAINEYEYESVNDASPVYSETGPSIWDEIRLTAPWITTQQPPKTVRDD